VKPSQEEEIVEKQIIAHFVSHEIDGIELVNLNEVQLLIRALVRLLKYLCVHRLTQVSLHEDL
jgi:hypothetical protein